MEKIMILLSTYNGEQFIRKQLDSLINQIGVDFHIVIRDDGSSDQTIPIIEDYIIKYPSLFTLFKGHNIGVAKSFSWLMEYANNIPNYRYYAFCDQDDIWYTNKLRIACDTLSQSNNNRPALFFSYFQMIDANGNTLPTNHTQLKLTLGEPVGGINLVHT